MKLYTADQAIRKPTKSQKFFSRAKLYVYIIPVVAGLLIFTLVPVVFSLVCSFQHVDLTAQQQLQGWTLENWKFIFDDMEDIGKSMFLTFRYAIFTVTTSITIDIILIRVCCFKC